MEGRLYRSTGVRLWGMHIGGRGRRRSSQNNEVPALAQVKILANVGCMPVHKVSVRLESDTGFGERRMTAEGLDRYRNNTWLMEHP